MKLLSTLFTIFGILLLTPSIGLTHEGHDHDGPSQFQPLKGGIVKSVETANIEVVSKDKKLEIFLFDNEGTPLDVTKFSLTAETKLPKAKKAKSLELTALPNSFEASFDAKGVHRYTLILSVKNNLATHGDKLRFTIEPKIISSEELKKSGSSNEK